MKLLLTLLALLSAVSLSADVYDCPSQPVLELYYSPYCPYSHRVLSYLESIQKTVPLRDVVHDKGATAELATRGGKKQVPCLFVDGVPIYESDQIIEWMRENKGCLTPKTRQVSRAPKARTSRRAARARYYRRSS